MSKNVLRTLFLNEAFSDFSIICEDGTSSWRFPVHSLVLSVHSPVFRAMLNSDLKENQTKCIEITDISPRILEKILRYMYLEKIDLECWTEATEVLLAAHKYHIELLESICSTYLSNNLRLENVLSIYQTANLYSLESLVAKSLQLILEAGFLFLRSPSFNMLSKNEVATIVSHKNLNVDSEVTVCKALQEWSTFNCCREKKEVNQSNIESSMKQFKSIIRWENILDEQKNQLPNAILPWMEKNGLRRIPHFLPESLLTYTTKVNFEPLDTVNHIDDTLISFSVNSPAYLIGIKFMSYSHHAVELDLLHSTEHVRCLNSSPNITLHIARFSFNFVSHRMVLENTHQVFESTFYFKIPILLQDSVNSATSTSIFPIRYIIQLRDGVSFPICRRNLVDGKFGKNYLTVSSTNVYGIKELIFL